MFRVKGHGQLDMSAGRHLKHELIALRDWFSRISGDAVEPVFSSSDGFQLIRDPNHLWEWELAELVERLDSLWVCWKRHCWPVVPRSEDDSLYSLYLALEKLAALVSRERREGFGNITLPRSRQEFIELIEHAIADFAGSDSPSRLGVPSSPETGQVDSSSPPLDPTEVTESDSDRATRHAEDFTSVTWFGQYYQFNKTQAEVVSHLWREYERGGFTMSEKTIAEKIDSAASNYRLAITFRDHLAWGTMIRQAGRGIYKLAPPESS